MDIELIQFLKFLKKLEKIEEFLRMGFSFKVIRFHNLL